MRIKFFPLPFLAGLAALVSINSCYFDNLQELHPELLLNNNCDTTITISYQTHIKPILSGSCGANNNCHNASGAGGGYVLENYAGVKNAAMDGKLLSSITWDGNASQMPKGSLGKLSDCAIAKIQKWIEQGALDN